MLEDLERYSANYGETGTGRTRHYVHDDEEAESRLPARHLHRVGALPATTCSSTRACTAPSSPATSTSRATPT